MKMLRISKSSSQIEAMNQSTTVDFESQASVWKEFFRAGEEEEIWNYTRKGRLPLKCAVLSRSVSWDRYRHGCGGPIISEGYTHLQIHA